MCITGPLNRTPVPTCITSPLHRTPVPTNILEMDEWILFQALLCLLCNLTLAGGLAGDREWVGCGHPSATPQIGSSLPA